MGFIKHARLKNPVQFIEALADLQPDTNSLRLTDIPETMFNELQSAYVIKSNRKSSASGHLFINFLEEHDFSSFQIADITFLSNILKRETYYVIGKYDTNEIILDKLDGMVKCKETHVDHVLELCAKDYMSFLDALLDVARYLKNCIFDEDLAMQQSQRCKVAYICSLKAGGETFENFYRNIVGCWE